jgi:1-acyl-sn-glycerol-3-phosphate acyltransferase
MRAVEGWQHSGAASLGREITARLFGPIFGWLIHGPKVVGKEHLRELDGPAIVCPTHASHLDTSALRLALGPHLRHRLAPAVAADYWRPSRVRWFLAAWLGAFPFVRSASADSIASAEALLAAGWSILLFPEGTRSRSGTMGPLKPGVGLIAKRSDRQVLPVLILGTRDVLPPGSRRPHRAQVEVRFGAPLRVGEAENVRAFLARLEAAIRAL